MPQLVALADYNIAYLYYFRGQYGRAIEALKATRDDCEKAGDAYLAALCRMDLAEIYLELNLSEDAAQMAGGEPRGVPAAGHGLRGGEVPRLSRHRARPAGQGPARPRALRRGARPFVKEQNSVWPALLDLYQALILFGAGRLFEARRPLHVRARRSFRSPRRWPARRSSAGCCWPASPCAWAS